MITIPGIRRLAAPRRTAGTSAYTAGWKAETATSRGRPPGRAAAPPHGFRDEVPPRAAARRLPRRDVVRVLIGVGGGRNCALSIQRTTARACSSFIISSTMPALRAAAPTCTKARVNRSWPSPAGVDRSGVLHAGCAGNVWRPVMTAACDRRPRSKARRLRACGKRQTPYPPRTAAPGCATMTRRSIAPGWGERHRRQSCRSTSVRA